MRILMISTDKKIFEPGSTVQVRMRDHASQIDELFIVILGLDHGLEVEGKLKYMGMTRLKALFWQPETDKKFDLVTSQDPFENGFIAWRLAKIIRAKLELQIHTDIGSPYFWQESVKNKIRFLLAKFLLPHANHIRVVSQRIADFLQAKKLMKLQATLTIRPIFVDVEKIKNTPITANLHQKYPQFDKIILMASRLTREKNIDLAIETIREIIKQNPKIGLIIVGSGPEERKLKLQATSCKLQAHVVFEPWVGPETLYSYYKTADLFLVASLYEGYGMTLVEAHAAGREIVSTDVGVAREIGATIIPLNPKEATQIILTKLT